MAADGPTPSSPSLPLKLLFTLAVSLALTEPLLRAAGRRPWTEWGVRADEPTMHEPDPILGWRVKPGEYVFSGYAAGAPPIRMTFWAGGERATALARTPRNERVVIVGESFTQGWAVSDHQTYAWKLQERFPSVEIINYGTAGYSTYQSLLRLQEILAAPGAPPRLVLYGFTGTEEERNVASFSWLLLLAQLSHRGGVSVPYCSLGPGLALERHAPETYPTWPLRRASAAVAAAQEIYFRLRTRGRLEQKRAVTERLLTEMAELSAARGTTLVVVFLGVPPAIQPQYATYLREREIRLVDCAHPLSAALLVPGEGHPNGRMHTLWADCIEAELRRILPGADDQGAVSGGPVAVASCRPRAADVR